MLRSTQLEFFGDYDLNKQVLRGIFGQIPPKSLEVATIFGQIFGQET